MTDLKNVPIDGFPEFKVNISKFISIAEMNCRENDQSLHIIAPVPNTMEITRPLLEMLNKLASDFDWCTAKIETRQERFNALLANRRAQLSEKQFEALRRFKEATNE